MSMKVIPPLKITSAMLTSCSAIETAPAAYAGGTTYALNATASVAGSAGVITVYRSLQASNTGHAPAASPAWWVSIGTTYQVFLGSHSIGDRVIDPAAHQVYESLIAANSGALSDQTKWFPVGPTNRWAMFDLLRNTATIQPGALTFSLALGSRVSALALMGMKATTATITMTSGGVTVYSVTRNLNARLTTGWYSYYLDAFGTKPSMVLFDLPPYANGIITVSLANTTGDVELGACVVGTAVTLGGVKYEAESDVVNFSTVTRDADGSAVMVQRRNVPKTIQSISCPKGNVNKVRALRDSLNASPAVWCGIDDDGDEYFEALEILGYYNRFTINLAYPQHAVISLELQEI
jgi:hypothetical protein